MMTVIRRPPPRPGWLGADLASERRAYVGDANLGPRVSQETGATSVFCSGSGLASDLMSDYLAQLLRDRAIPEIGRLRVHASSVVTDPSMPVTVNFDPPLKVDAEVHTEDKDPAIPISRTRRRWRTDPPPGRLRCRTALPDVDAAANVPRQAVPPAFSARAPLCSFLETPTIPGESRMPQPEITPRSARVTATAVLWRG